MAVALRDGFQYGPTSQWHPSPFGLEIDISEADPSSSLPEDILYRFGSNFGTSVYSNPLDGVRVGAYASASGNNRLPTVLGDRANSVFQMGGGGVNVSFDFDPRKQGVRVRLTHLFLQNANSGAAGRLINFVVEAGEGNHHLGVDTVWTAIASVNDAGFYPSPNYGWSNVLELAPIASSYRFVRIRTTGPDQYGGYFWLASEVLFGGFVSGVSNV